MNSSSNSALLAPDLVVWKDEQASVVFSAKRGLALFVDHETGDRLKEFAKGREDSTLNENVSELIHHDFFREAGVTRFSGNAEPPSNYNAVASGDTIKFLDLIVSEGCNFGCPHCIHSRDVKSSSTRQLNTFMSLDVAKAAIDEFVQLLRAHSRTELLVHIGSAEPLINWPTVEYIVNYVSALEFAQKRITINSNLSLLSEERAKFLIEHGVIINTSLDGIKRDNDRVRVRKSGAATFDGIVEKIQMLRHLGYEMDALSLTVTDATIFEFDTIGYIQLLKELGMRGVSVDFDLVGSVAVQPAFIAKFLLNFYDACGAENIECYGTWTKPYENLFRNDLELNLQVPVGFCKAVEGGNVSVSPQGRFFMCGYTSSELGSLGQMVDGYGQRLATLLQTRSRAVEAHCTGCDLVGVCGGQCHATHEVGEFENSGKVDAMCEVYRAVTENLTLRRLREEWK